MNSVRQILEIDKILEQVKHYIKTPYGRELILSLDVYNEKSDCEKELNKLSEMITIIERYNDLPINNHIDIKQLIDNAYKGSIIDERSFNDIKEVILSSKELIKYYAKIEEKPLLLNEYFTKIKFDEKLYNEITRIITIDNTVSDNASPALSSIRRNLEKADREIHSIINKLMISYKDQVSGDNYVMRNGVYVLPISTSLKNSVDGIVHDISDSGQTTFIEPLEIVNLENNKHVYEIQEKEEVTRILRELTNKVMNDADLLITNDRVIGYLDFVSSKVHYCFEIEGTVPELSNQQEVKLNLARHPLLDKKNVVSNDFILGKDKTLMLISGPNAGGKTIALKTVATIAYMAKLALPIPAEKGSAIGFFRKIYVDIGDSQSIENNLSTFSAHMSILSVLLKYISSKDLVIIDELGNGTDPKEGEALSMAVVEYLLNRKCLTLITSHYTLLKQFGLTNKNVLSASFIFNEEKIEPTFRIIYDVTGKSYGFSIAKKYGLNDSIVDRAKKIFEENYIDDEDRKLEMIEDKERALHEKVIALEQRKKELDSANTELNKKKKQLEEKEKNLKEKKIEDFDDYMEKKIDEIDEIVEEFKRSDKKSEKAFISRINKMTLNKKVEEPLNINDYVLIKGLGIEGKIVRIAQKKISIVTRDGFSMNASIDQCEKIDGPSNYKRKTSNIDAQIMNKKTLSSSLNLIGYHVDEAIFALDKYLSDCYGRGLHVVKVIHGYGSGQLRMGIHSHLKTVSYVESFRLGSDIDGGTGSTIITLK